ncbi:MAG: MerR family transcriptional regulator [Anaerolineae bacterium]|nr:MerR family transcriptional regulator [Anaerolineae bacterium]
MNVERTIQQVAHETGVSSFTLRYYERIGLILDVARAPNGHRRYSEADLEWIAFLKQLKATGMPLTEMQKFAELRRQGNHTAKQRRQMLESHRKSILQQRQMLDDCLAVIDMKIERHRRTELQGDSNV